MNESIVFKKLNGLTPTEQSCTFKLLEEVGEVMEIIGKWSGLNGENKTYNQLSVDSGLIDEYMDVAQAATTAVRVLCEKHGISVNEVMKKHEQKLRERGYLK